MGATSGQPGPPPPSSQKSWGLASPGTDLDAISACQDNCFKDLASPQISFNAAISTCNEGGIDPSTLEQQQCGPLPVGRATPVLFDAPSSTS
eukprot:6789432-Karenia_brevis.AAC.1